MTKMIPLGNRVLLKKIEEKPEETKAGVLILPESAKKRIDTYQVIDYGASVRGKSITIGDKVILDRYVGHHVELEDGPYLIVKEEEIALVEENEFITR